jgi:SAM-dependent methyltransferase
VPAFADAWLTLARLRRKAGRPSAETWMKGRRQWIRDHAPGRSFADIGGLFGIHGEVALLAEEAGATRVTLFDAGDPEYTEFPAERERRGSRVRFVQGDLEDPASVADVGAHDIVWCAGVIYHTPNPVLQLMHLRDITRELLFLGTRTIPEVPGVPQACLYYPYLDDEQRLAHARPYGNTGKGWGIGEPFVDRPMLGHGNFWWGITPSALRAMLRTARFEVVEERRSRDWPWHVDVVARPIAKAPLLPPRGYYRARAERRANGEKQLRFEDYYLYAGPAYSVDPQPARQEEPAPR